MEDGRIIASIALAAIIICLLQKLVAFLRSVYALKQIREEVLDVDGSDRNDRWALIRRWTHKETLLRYELMRYLDRRWVDRSGFVEKVKQLLSDPEANIRAYVDRRRNYGIRFPFVRTTTAIAVIIEKPYADKFQLEAIPWELGRRILMLYYARIYLGIRPSELRPRAW